MPPSCQPPIKALVNPPAPEKNRAWNQPLMPGLLKYSALATNVTRRGSDILIGRGNSGPYILALLVGLVLIAAIPGISTAFL